MKTIDQLANEMIQTSLSARVLDLPECLAIAEMVLRNESVTRDLSMGVNVDLLQLASDYADWSLGERRWDGDEYDATPPVAEYDPAYQPEFDPDYDSLI